MVDALRRSARGEKYDLTVTLARTKSRLLKLPPELIRAIFDRLYYPVDVIMLCLAHDHLGEIGEPVAEIRIRQWAAPWVGHHIMCIGDYAEDADLPPQVQPYVLKALPPPPPAEIGDTSATTNEIEESEVGGDQRAATKGEHDVGNAGNASGSNDDNTEDGGDNECVSGSTKDINGDTKGINNSVDGVANSTEDVDSDTKDVDSGIDDVDGSAESNDVHTEHEDDEAEDEKSGEAEDEKSAEDEDDGAEGKVDLKSPYKHGPRSTEFYGYYRRNYTRGYHSVVTALREYFTRLRGLTRIEREMLDEFLWDGAPALAMMPPYRSRVLCNITKGEYVRADAVDDLKIRLEKTVEPRAGLTITLGQAMLSMICWSTDSSCALRCDAQRLTRGPWTGDAFRVTTFERWDPEQDTQTWRDATDEIVEWLEELWRTSVTG